MSAVSYDAVDIVEAARRLGTTPAALRKRLQRHGRLDGYDVTKDDAGQWRIVLPSQDSPTTEDSGPTTAETASWDVSQDAATDIDPGPDQTTGIRLAVLEAELTAAREALARRDADYERLHGQLELAYAALGEERRVVAGLIQRLALPAPASHQPDPAPPPEPTSEPAQPRRPWWRRWQ